MITPTRRRFVLADIHLPGFSLVNLNLDGIFRRFDYGLD
jgi:hypothetical protein